MEKQDAFEGLPGGLHDTWTTHFLDSESDFNYSGRMADDEDRLIRYVVVY